jgi:antagonist of KipI
MRNPTIRIIKGGLLSTVQDTGRYGFQRYGMPAGGAMDVFSLLLANRILGNQQNAPCIETTMDGPMILFKAEAYITICGADMQPRINDKSVKNNRVIIAKPGDVLSFKGLRTGCRSYIAFAGGLKIEPVMGSCATYLPAGIGGFKGRKLKAGDEIELANQPVSLVDFSLPENLNLIDKPKSPIRIIPGPEISYFAFSSIQKLLNSDFTILPQSDRMAYRLDGVPVFPLAGKADIISSGIPFGTIQIPADGQPIIMMADRPTTGGYPRIAVVASVDLPRLAQLKPGDRIQFREIGLEQAGKLYQQQMDFFTLH